MIKYEYQNIPMREAFPKRLVQPGGAQETRAGQNSAQCLGRKSLI